ncbi:MAG: hypothetical protein ACH350_05855 [Parachlamydiaceae bacterium]
MSQNTHFSQDEDSNVNSHSHDKREEKPQFHAPEFVLIDERDGDKKYSYFGSSSFEQSQRTKEAQTKIEQSPKGSLRFISFLGFVFCFILGLGMLVWSGVMTLLALFCLFQNPHFNQGMWKFWKYFAHTFIAAFCFMLAVISPALGLGLLALYFSLASQLVDEDFLRKIIRRSFNHL